MSDGAAAATGWAARTSARYDSLAATPSGLQWVERDPASGHSVLATWTPSRGTVLGTVPIGSDVHAYGGGAFVGTDSGTWVVRESDGQVWHADSGVRLTGSPHRHGGLSGGDGLLLCVRETATHDQLVIVDPAGPPESVVVEAPFLGSAVLDGGRLAWTRWEGGTVPWDSSEVWVARHESGVARDATRIAGGPHESAVQPRWAPDGFLYFMSDRTGWWNLYRWRAGRTEPVAPMRADCAAAPWELDYLNYAFVGGGRVALTAQTGPLHRLFVVEAAGTVRPVELPYTSIKPYLAAVDDRVALIGGSPDRDLEVALVATDGSDGVKVIRAGDRAPATAVAVPEIMRISSGDALVTVLFHPPRAESTAPVIVRPHPGPTHHSAFRLDEEVQFFVRNGFGVADVDYRGSTGYGRAFRKALDGQWGILDVEDCRAVAQHLLDTGRARPGGLFISGASAGGYTALRAVCEDGPFALAVARSAIVDPQRWAHTAPRFQRPHATILSSADAKVLPSRFTAPALLIHGDDDTVAPIADVTALAGALARRGLLHGFLRLPGVGHYLSAPDALATALHAELAAYRAVLGRVAAP